jgi:hypothetical protein
MTLGNYEFKNGMTVKELKEIIKDWPEMDKYGDPTEVWVGHNDNLSSPVRELWILNHDKCDGQESADLLLKIFNK